MQDRLTQYAMVIFCVILLAYSAVSLLGSAAPIHAQSSESMPQGSQTQEVETDKYSGEVVELKSDSLTIEQDDGSVREFEIDEDVNVERNNMDSSYEDLEVGDKVDITTDSAGDVLKIEARSAAFDNILLYAIPVGLVLLILIVSGLYLMRSNNKGQIKTMSTPA